MRRARPSLILLAAGMTACDRGRPPAAVVPASRPAAAAVAATQTVPATDDAADVTARLPIAGITDPEGVRRFLAALQDAAARDDRGKILHLVSFPFTTYEHGKVAHTYRTRAALSADFARVFTPDVYREIAVARYASLFVRDEGVMIGRGEVWFNDVRFADGTHGIRIIAVNGGITPPPTPP